MSFAKYQDLDGSSEVFSLPTYDGSDTDALSSYNSQKVVVVSFIDLKAWFDSGGADATAHGWLDALNTMAGGASFVAGDAALLAVLYRNGDVLTAGSIQLQNWIGATTPVFPVLVDVAWDVANPSYAQKFMAGFSGGVTPPFCYTLIPHDSSFRVTDKFHFGSTDNGDGLPLNAGGTAPSQAEAITFLETRVGHHVDTTPTLDTHDPADGACTGAILSVALGFSEPVLGVGFSHITKTSGHISLTNRLTGTSTDTAIAFTLSPAAGLASDFTLDGFTPALKDGTVTVTLSNIIDTSGAIVPDEAITFTRDTVGPQVVGNPVLDSQNRWIDIAFNEPVYGAGGTGPVLLSAFGLIFDQNGGHATGAAITGITRTDGSALVGGETSLRLNLHIDTPPAYGVETITLSITASGVCDCAGNPAQGALSWVINLFDTRPLITERYAEFVLDFSDTMNSLATVPGPGGTTQSDTRVNFLRDALAGILNVWKTAASLSPHASDKAGIITFSSDSAERLCLSPVDPIATDMLDSDPAAGCTALGSGLARALVALDYLTSVPTRGRCVILITDGMQNVNPMVYYADNANPLSSVLIDTISPSQFPPGGFTCPSPDAYLPPGTRPYVVYDDGSLGRTNNVPIHTIGIGDSGDLEALLTRISGGQYVAGVTNLSDYSRGLHFQADALWPDLITSFSNILVHLFKGSSLQIMHSATGSLHPRGGSSSQQEIDAFTLSQSVKLLTAYAAWPGPAEVELTLLHDGSPVKATRRLGGAHHAVVSVAFSKLGAVSPLGAWSVRADRKDSGASDLPLNCVVFLDDRAFDFDIQVPQIITATAKPDRFEVRITDKGKPISGKAEATLRVTSPRQAPANVVARYGSLLGTQVFQQVRKDLSAAGSVLQEVRKNKEASAALDQRVQKATVLKADSAHPGRFFVDLPKCAVAGNYQLDFSFKVFADNGVQIQREVRRTLTVLPDLTGLQPQIFSRYNEIKKMLELQIDLMDKLSNCIGVNFGRGFEIKTQWHGMWQVHDLGDGGYGVRIDASAVDPGAWKKTKIEISYGGRVLYANLVGKIKTLPGNYAGRLDRMNFSKPVMEVREK